MFKRVSLWEKTSLMQAGRQTDRQMDIHDEDDTRFLQLLCGRAYEPAQVNKNIAKTKCID